MNPKASPKRRHRRRGRGRRRINKKRLALLLAMLAAFLIVVFLLISGLVKLVRGIISKDPTDAKSVTVESTLDMEETEAGTVASPADAESSSEDTSAESVTETETESTAAAVSYVGTLPDIDINSWEFMLVNANNPCGDYAPETAEVGRVTVDARIADALTRFVEAAEAQGLPVFLSSAYRDYDWQTTLFENKIAQGYSREKAATIVAPPGTSEHQTGLAADITDVYRKTKDKSLEETETYKWMSAHCQEYGFVVRYPNEKQDVTGIIYEPWHFRYVGVEVATFMMNNNLCLEEFIALYQN